MNIFLIHDKNFYKIPFLRSQGKQVKWQSNFVAPNMVWQAICYIHNRNFTIYDLGKIIHL